MVLRKKKQETKQKEGKKEDVPFWLQIWNMCICSEAYKRKAIIDGIIGASFCENKQIPRYGMLLAEEKKIVLREEMPKNHRMLRQGEKPKGPDDEDRLTFTVDGEGVIEDAYYG